MWHRRPSYRSRNPIILHCEQGNFGSAGFHCDLNSSAGTDADARTAEANLWLPPRLTPPPPTQAEAAVSLTSQNTKYPREDQDGGWRCRHERSDFKSWSKYEIKGTRSPVKTHWFKIIEIERGSTKNIIIVPEMVTMEGYNRQKVLWLILLLLLSSPLLASLLLLLFSSSYNLLTLISAHQSV